MRGLGECNSLPLPEDLKCCQVGKQSSLQRVGCIRVRGGVGSVCDMDADLSAAEENVLVNH